MLFGQQCLAKLTLAANWQKRPVCRIASIEKQEKSWPTGPKHVTQQKQLYIDVGGSPSRYVLIGVKSDSLAFLTANIGIASMLHYRAYVLGFGAKLTRPTQANADWLQVLLL